MGKNFSNMFGEISSTSESRLLILGLDAAGKTTILYRLKLGEYVTTVPTIGFNVENYELKKKKFVIWDVGGIDKIRSLWRHYYPNTNAIVFVVDSTDRARIQEASDEMKKVMDHEELEGVPFLIFANKTDLESKMSLPEIVEHLGLTALRGRPWYVQGSCALTGEGLEEGIDWIRNKLNPSKKKL